MKTTDSSTASKHKQSGTHSRNRFLQEAQAEALDHGLIADLANEQIRQMAKEELVRVIKAANPSVLNADCRQRLHLFDQVTLQRLAFLARYCCQNHISRTQISGKGRHARFNSKKK
ncbi:hypothetical protein Pan241w_15880 [Gimesia alba]|uniref:Uncharacterized protein n=1 Tax=Gimesia alba TaxID=2527973 RepID=A0A517RCC7_9PLAN|nr:hypothetical protein [Gimesia alba]QDT41525.1 hypothetical protein Pan241w_15880 [Gimesia alba]